MRFLINSIKVFHAISIALFLTTIYACIFVQWEWIVFVIVTLFLCIGTKREYEELEEEIRDTIEEIQASVKSFCEENEGRHTIEVPYGNKYYSVELCHHIEIAEEVGVEHMGAYEIIPKVVDEYITILSLECKDEHDLIWDCGFTAKDIQEGL